LRSAFHSNKELFMHARSWIAATMSALFLVLAGCASAPPSPAPIADATARNPQLTTLNRLIAEAGLADTLRGPGPYTVFAPSDEAFKGLKPEQLRALSQDKSKLKALLSYHVLPGRVTAAEAADGRTKTLEGGELALAKAGSFLTVEDAVVTQADLPASNGVVHVIDRVLMPPKKH
jgi:uncharacterized surface protein with fasciclin (FAS1) repeats